MFFFGIVLNVHAQNSFKVTYHISEVKLQGSAENLNEEGKHFTQQVIDYSKNVNYILISNQKASYFEAEEGLSKESDSPLEEILSRMSKRFTSFNTKSYINYEQDSIVFVRNLVGQDFTVIRECYNFIWSIKKDSKTILGFEAKKAEGTYHHPVTNKELKVIAWFIPSIPLQSGPDIFTGLPGLIAEVDLQGAVVTAKQIEPNKSMIIKKVDASKAMSQIEFENVIQSLTKKFDDYIND